MRRSEREVVAFFVGEKVNSLRISSVAHICCEATGDYKDCVECAINISELRQAGDEFVRSYRELKNLDLMLLLYLKGETIVGIRVFKYKTIFYPEGKTSGYETTPNQEDIDQITQVLRFVVHRGKERSIRT